MHAAADLPPLCPHCGAAIGPACGCQAASRPGPLGQPLIYFDQAATSWPKPESVIQAMEHFFRHVGANPGRSGHRLSIESGRVVYAAREAVADLFHAASPLRVVFGANATAALNLALHGLLRPGDHVVTSGMEHNSVMRPLRALESRGVTLSVAACREDGSLDPAVLEAAIQPRTKLLALTHASNVCGTLLPIAAAGEIARRKGLLLLVDAAQTAGAVPIDVQADRIDLLAFTGHKSLLGPTGTGGLYVGERVDLEGFQPLLQGGTGSLSEREEHPRFLPDLGESGTPNAAGLAGLAAGVRWVLAQGVDAIRNHEQALVRRLVKGLAAIPGVRRHGGGDGLEQTATVSFNISGMAPSSVGLQLDEDHGILCRVGLHCAPAAHRTLGTYPEGTVRFALGCFNTAAEVDLALEAVDRIARGR